MGEWVKFPTTAEELKQVFERIGIGAKDDFGQIYEEWFITDYDCYVDGLYDLMGEYANLDELNYLASKLDDMSQDEYERFQAAMEIGDHTGSIQELINLTENLDCYDVYPDIHEHDDLGRYYIEELDAMQVPEHLRNYIDYEAYGRDIALGQTQEDYLPSEIKKFKDATGYEEFLDVEPQAIREAIENPDQSHVDEMLAFAEQANREYEAELYGQQAAPTPDDRETGETVQTPGGTFHVTDMSREQMEAAGYGFHHESEDGKYLIMGNGSRAFAIPSGDAPEHTVPEKLTVLVVGLGEESFTSLPPELAQKYTEQFKRPELFASINGQIVSVPVEPENPLRTAEMTLEDDYGMIDGIINNGRRGEELEKAQAEARRTTPEKSPPSGNG